ncbi:MULTISPECIES: hypothetical protein [unclassified Sphingomonas]|uniref:hypothetical protein n=1 Tax=unclassified Sphingomonas TaxID=196159 RepID=UPI000B2C8FF2|nr:MULTISPECIES: hypothetical protein [unclassified Sphingomonas]TCP71278.1 hypothetical protein C8J43_102353 [Sphingomonas sp. PP-CE-1G-424]
MVDSSWLEKARDLRQQAYEALQATPAYAAFKAFDDAVVGLGGAPFFEASPHAQPVKVAAARALDAAVKRTADSRKLSQGDAAELVLMQHQEPLPIVRLMEEVQAKGAEIGGTDPLNNFRSTVSKDPRFRTSKRNNMYFWWLTDQPLPPQWNEPTDPDLLTASVGSSSHSDQETANADHNT